MITLTDYNLAAAERLLCSTALEEGGNIVQAAKLLGITRHSLQRRITKLALEVPAKGRNRKHVATTENP